MPTDGTRVVLSREAIERYLSGRTVVVLDGFRRAPFEVGLEVFAEARNPYLSMDDLVLKPERRRYGERGGLTTVATAGRGSRAGGLVGGRSFVGVGRGRGVMWSLAHLGGTRLPVSGYRMSRDATGLALGYSGGLGRWQAVAAKGARERDVGAPGFSGWNPETVLAASFSPNRAAVAPGSDTFGVAFASELHQPMGWRGSGAFGLKGDSFELAWKRNIMARDTVRVDVASRRTHLAVRRHLAVRSGPVLRFHDAQVASVDLDLSFRIHRFATVGARLGAERPVSSVAGRIRTAAAVDESGRIAYRDLALGGRDLLSFDKASMIVRLAADSSASVGVGVTAVRDGFGRTETLAGVRMGFEF